MFVLARPPSPFAPSDIVLTPYLHTPFLILAGLGSVWVLLPVDFGAVAVGDEKGSIRLPRLAGSLNDSRFFYYSFLLGPFADNGL